MTEPPRDEPSSGSTADSSGSAAFEEIDWEQVDDSRRWRSAERIALVVGLLVVLAAYYYFRTYRRTNLFWQWSIGNEDWLLMLAAVILVAYGLVPLARNPSSLRRTLGRLRRRVPTALSLLFLSVLLGISLWAMLRGFEPSLGSPGEGWTVDTFQPPVGTSVGYDFTGKDCVGELTGDQFDFDRSRQCHGTWEYPLGTDNWGYDMRELLIAGAQPFAYLSLVTLGLIVPLATAVGMSAGYFGGRVDDLLMAYVDVQLSVPAILIYMVAYMFVFNSMAMLLVAFGLLSWGGIARIVRSETLQRSEEGYVLAAQSIGAPNWYILRRHLFPNITNTVVPATFHLIAILVLTEAGLAFIGFHTSFQSWGMTISEGVFYGRTQGWWNSLLPAVALALTVGALKVAGDGFRDVLDPRGDR
jgi:peptide/nickel transport system permease protein